MQKENSHQQPIGVIVNGAAGGGKCATRAQNQLSKLQKSYTLKIHFTDKPGHATKIANDLFNLGIREFWSVGGDGTTFEILNGLFPQALNDPIILGVIPLGTGNSFIMDFDTNIANAQQKLQQHQAKPVDLFRLTHSEGEIFFINIISFGFAADVATLTNRYLKWMGPTGYSVGVILRLMGLKSWNIPYRLSKKHSFNTDPMTMLSISNSKYTGDAMKIAPHANVNDGLLDLICIKQTNRRTLLKAFPKIFKGTHIEMDEVIYEQSATIEFNLNQRITAVIDGDIYHIIPEKIDIFPLALEIII